MLPNIVTKYCYQILLPNVIIMLPVCWDWVELPSCKVITELSSFHSENRIYILASDLFRNKTTNTFLRFMNWSRLEEILSFKNIFTLMINLICILENNDFRCKITI